MEPSKHFPENVVWYRSIQLVRVQPHNQDQVERYETPCPGPFPWGTWLILKPNGQWCAGFQGGRAAYSWDAEDALDEAHRNAINDAREHVRKLEALLLEE